MLCFCLHYKTESLPLSVAHVFCLFVVVFSEDAHTARSRPAGGIAQSQISTPSTDVYPDKLLFTGVDVTKDKDHLRLFFKDVAGCDPIKDLILFGDTAGHVLVTFRGHPGGLLFKCSTFAIIHHQSQC